MFVVYVVKTLILTIFVLLLLLFQIPHSPQHQVMPPLQQAVVMGVYVDETTPLQV